MTEELQCTAVMTAEDLLCDNCRAGRGMNACTAPLDGERAGVHLHFTAVEMDFVIDGRPVRLANGRLSGARASDCDHGSCDDPGCPCTCHSWNRPV